MSSKPGLTQRSITAASWGMSGSILRILLQMGSQIVLARILGPAQYGVFAIGVMVVSFANYLADTGLAYGLVQRKTVSKVDIRFIFTWQVILGLLVSSLIVIAAQPLAYVFKEPRAEYMLMALSGVCLINALTTPSINLLKRDLDHRTLQIAQVFAYAVGYVGVGIPLALSDFGVWALVYAWLTVALIQLIVLYSRVRHPLMPKIWFSGAKEHLQFGGLVFLTNLINWFMTNVDKAIAARFFPGANLGLYSTAFTLLNTPTTVVYSTVQSVVFSAAARVQDRPDAISRAYLKLMGLLGGLFIPAFGVLAVVSETMVLALYGAAWQGASPMLSAFACAMPMILFWGISTPILWNTGQASREILVQLPIAILWMAGAYFAVQYSVVVLAWSLTFCFLLRMIFIGAIVCNTLKVTLADLFSTLRGPALTTLILVPIIYSIDSQLAALGLPAMLVLAIDAIAAGLILMVIFWKVAASLSGPSRALLADGVSKLPNIIRPFVAAIVRGPA